MPPHHRYSLHDIRKWLNRIFDDPGLDAFCPNNFTELYDQFGQGIQKEVRE